MLLLAAAHTAPDLLTLAVDITLQHREIDQPKRKGSWVAKLRQTAQYAVESTAPEYFSSSKSAAFNVEMRERALAQILPTLFDVAQSYEDHLAQYNLYEGAGTTDPGNGKHHTWHTITRPSRQPAHRKRARRTRPVQAPIVDCDMEASGDETEVDDTISNSFLRRRQAHARKQARTSQQAKNTAAAQQQMTDMPPNTASRATTPATSRPSPVTAQPEFRSNHSCPTPSNSFDQSMNSLNLGEGVDMDVKGGFVQYEEQTLLPNMYALGQPTPYSGGFPDYANPVFQPQDNVGPFTSSSQSFTHEPGHGFLEAFPMYTPNFPPQTSSSNFRATMTSTNAGFPYEHEGVFPPIPAATHTCQ